MKPDRDIGHSIGRIALASLTFVMGSALAQTQAHPLDLRLPQPPDDLRPQVGQDATPDENASDATTSVHGSFTTGIGYSRAYGNSTVNAAEIDISKQYDNVRSLNLHIDVMHSTGLPAAGPHDYVSRYPGY